MMFNTFSVAPKLSLDSSNGQSTMLHKLYAQFFVCFVVDVNLKSLNKTLIKQIIKLQFIIAKLSWTYRQKTNNTHHKLILKLKKKGKITSLIYIIISCESKNLLILFKISFMNILFKSKTKT